MAAIAPAIVLLGLAVRVYRLDSRSLWLDEILTGQTAHLNSAGDVITWSQAALNQMPLYYMFTWFLGRWGDSGVLLRLPAVIAGALVVPAIYVVARRLFGSQVALVAGLLSALWPYMVWYSQEARNYSLLMLLTTMQMYFAYRAVAYRRAGDWVGLALFTILNLYCHYLALLTTFAAAVYVGGFLLADTARANRKLQLAIGGGLAAIAALAILLPWRPLLKWLYAEASLFAAHRLWSLAAAVMLLALLGCAAAYLQRRSPELLLPLGTAALVALAYAPWLPALKTLASRPDQTFGQIHLAHAPNLGDAGALLGSLSLGGLMLLALVAGLISLGADAFRTRSPESFLPLAWIGLPLLVFGFLSRSTIVDIDPRYLSFLVPGAVLIVAVGVVAAARVAERAWRSAIARVAPNLTLPLPVAAIVVVAAVFAQAIAGLAHSYDLNKNDYRAVAQHIAAGSPPQSVVLAVGNYSDWSVTCLDYYFRQLHSTVTVVDGLQVDSDVLDRLAQNGAVWGVVIFPSSAQQSLLSGSGAVREDFVDSTHQLHVVRPADQSVAATTQAATLLRWESQIEPQLEAPARLLDLQAGQAARGPNLLPAPSAAWTLGPGAGIVGDSIVLTGRSDLTEVDAAVSVPVQPISDYLVSLTPATQAPGVTLYAFAVVRDQAGRELGTFPSGGGFALRAAPPRTSFFAFMAPAGASSVEILVRLRGTGVGQLRDVQLAELSSK